MKIIELENYDALSRAAADQIISALEKNKSALICAATGNSPTGTYGLLKNHFDLHPELFSDLRIIKLDEWGGLPLDDPSTCESYLVKHLTGPLQITAGRYISFQSNPEDPARECDRIQRELSLAGPIDLCILGLGVNGHLALNEPGAFLVAGPHKAELSETSLMHPMIERKGGKPSFGLTLGMADILRSACILFLVSGSKKKDILSDLMNRQISTSLPASFLWLHPNVVCLIDRNVRL